MAEATKMLSTADIETAVLESSSTKVAEVSCVRRSLAGVVGACGLLALCAVVALINPTHTTQAAASTSSSRSLEGGRVKIGAHRFRQ